MRSRSTSGTLWPSTVPTKTHSHNVLKVVRLLRSGHSLDQICSTYTLKLRRHPVEPLLSLSYDQRAHFEHEVTRECRGLVLEDKTFNVIAMPFMKFFNAAEPLGKATNFDWATAKVYEKLDGSLMTLYWHKGRWIVASSRCPRRKDPSGPPSGTRGRREATSCRSAAIDATCSN